MRHAERIKFLIAGMVVIAVSLAAEPVLAQNGLDRITNVYRDGAAAWGPSLRNYAIGLFALLATLEFVWSFARLAIKGADFGEFMAEFFTRLMFIMFFYWLMIASGEIAPAIVNSFREAGNTAAQAGGGSGGMRPSDIWTAGVDMASRIMETEVGLTDIPKGLALVVSGLVLIVVFACLAALMIIALVESYIVMAAAVLFLGFGGSRWTKDIAVKTLIYCVSVGAKLFTVQILVGMAEAMVKAWTNDVGGGGFAEDMTQVLEIIGASIVMLALTISIPNIIQGMINGSSMGSFNPVTAAAGAVAGGAVGAGALLAGGGMAMSGAAKLASEQLKAADAAGTGPTTGLGRAGALVGGTMSNLAKGSLNDAGQRLAGRVRSGNAPASIGASLHDAAGSMQKERMRPAAPAPFAAPQPAAAMATAGAGAGEGGGSIRPDMAGAPGPASGPTEGAAPIRAAAPEPEAKLASAGTDPTTSTAGPGAASTVAGAAGTASAQPGGVNGASGGAATGGPASRTGGKSAATALGDDARVAPLGQTTSISGAPESATGTPEAGEGGKSAVSAMGADARPQQPGQGQTVEGAAQSQGPLSSAAAALAADYSGPDGGEGGTITGAEASDGPSQSPARSASEAVASAAASAPVTAATVQGASASSPANGDAGSSAVSQDAPSAGGTVGGAPATAKTITADPAKSEPTKPQRRRGMSLSDRASGAARDIHGAPPSKPKPPKSQ